jgi:hypothetical protein
MRHQFSTAASLLDAFCLSELFDPFQDWEEAQTFYLGRGLVEQDKRKIHAVQNWSLMSRVPL